MIKPDDQIKKFEENSDEDIDINDLKILEPVS
jgi:hypothetical protein